MVPDGTGGGYFEWRSYLNDGSGKSRLYVQHVSAAGIPLWNGTAQVVAEPDDGGNGWMHSRMVADGTGGAVIAWNAFGTSPGFDISAQRLAGDGTRPWSSTPRVIASLPSAAWQMGVVADGTGGVVASWMNFIGSTTPNVFSAERIFGSGTLDAPPPQTTFRGVRCAPTPARAGDAITLRFVLPQAGKVNARVLDTSGRQVRSLSLGSAPAGEQALVWDGRDEQGHRVRPGLYLVRVEAAGANARGRAVVVE